jgi:tetratricopeptide (TPR) repeat protein
MRFLSTIMVMIGMIGCQSLAKNCEELFLQANNLYRAGNFKESLKVYDAIDPKGWAVLYNMGAAWYQQGDYVQALVYWRRAQKAGGAHSELVQQSLAEVMKLLGMEIQENWWASVGKARKLTVFQWQLIFLMLWLVLIGWLRYAAGRRIFVTTTMMFSCLIAAFGLWFRAREEYDTNAIAIESVPVLIGKDERFNHVAQLQPGQEVTVLSQDPNWLKVKNGATIGWVPAERLTLI